MAPTVTLKISNPNNEDYPTINLRKFFNMVFVDPKGKKLSIYTATVFSGAERVNLDNLAEKETPPKPKAGRERRCSLQFEYVVNSEDVSDSQNHVLSAECTDITTKFLSQKGKRPNRNEIKHVWGEVTTLTGQGHLKNELRTLYPDQYKVEDDPNLSLPDMSEGGPYLRITKNDRGASHQFVACPGQFIEGNAKNKYTLTASNVVGLEAINWVKTTIELSSDILKPTHISDRKIDFVVQFAENDIFYTPDFTWYFAPPPNYVVDDDMARVDIGDKKDVDNIVTSVADRTTVRFAEWLKEGILERKKWRVLSNKYLPAEPYLLTNSLVKVNLSFSNPGKHGNLQFLVGLIVSHFLGFCSDVDRLAGYLSACSAAELCKADCVISAIFHQKCICENICNSLSILFPVALIFAFFALCFRARDCIPEDDRNGVDWLAITLRWVGWAATVFLVAYINVGWLIVPDFMSKVIKSCVANQAIVVVSMVISLAFTGFYTMYCWLVKKRNLIDFF